MKKTSSVAIETPNQTFDSLTLNHEENDQMFIYLCKHDEQ